MCLGLADVAVLIPKSESSFNSSRRHREDPRVHPVGIETNYSFDTANDARGYKSSQSISRMDRIEHPGLSTAPECANDSVAPDGRVVSLSWRQRWSTATKMLW